MSSISNIVANVNENQSIVSNNFDNDNILNQILSESGLNVDDCPNWRLISNIELNKKLGRDGKDKLKGDAIEIPYYMPPVAGEQSERIEDSGLPFSRFKLLEKQTGDKAGMRYAARAASGNHLFIPANFITETLEGDTLYITEGEKKAAAGCKAGYHFVAIPGVQQWADSAARNAEKVAAEELGTAIPALSEDTPIMPLLMMLICEYQPAKIVVSFDADGAVVTKAETAGDSKFKQLFANKDSYVLNKDVHFSAIKLAKAIRNQTNVPTAYGFVPHQRNENGGLSKRGLDDLIMQQPELVNQLLTDLADSASTGNVTKTKVSIEKTYVPLGYTRSESGGQTSYFWSKLTNQICALSENQLKNKVSVFAVIGADYAKKAYSITIEKKNGASESIFDFESVQETLLTEAQKAGVWNSDGRRRGAGVWYAGKDSLIVNAKNGVFKVSASGVEPVERCVESRQEIFEQAKRGTFSEVEASADDVRQLIETISKSWSWRSKSDGILSAGWVLLQAYVAALDARPMVYLNGESGCGKSYLQEYLSCLLGNWAIRVENGKDSSVAGVRQALASDAITAILDEIEPKAAASEHENANTNKVIRGLLQMFRGAYSQSRTGSFSAVKGTAAGHVQNFDVRTCAMLAGIAASELEQADKNRMLRVQMNKLERGENGQLLGNRPSLPESSLGASIFRCMWSRWGSYTTVRDALARKIEHNEERMRLTLASPLAAILTALDMSADSAYAVEMLALVNQSHAGSDALDDQQTDKEVLRSRLSQYLVAVDGANGREQMPLASVIAAALRDGMGSGAGRGKNGGFAGKALINLGMKAKIGVSFTQNGTTTQAPLLFVSNDNVEVQKIGRSLGFPAVVQTLKMIPGAVPTTKTTRERVGDAGKVSGVWVPMPDIEMLPEGVEPISDDEAQNRDKLL